MADEDSKAGYGQMHPSDTAGPYNVEEFVIRQIMAGMATVKAVQVVSVNEGQKTVDVVPLVKLVDGSGNATDQGTIFGIPYAQLQWGKNAVVGTPAEKDIGILLCCDRDISAVKSTKAAAPPPSNRKFSPSDGIYYGGFANGDVEQSFEFKSDGIAIKAKGGLELTTNQTTGWNFKGIVTFQNNVQLGGSILGAAGGVYDKAISTTAAIQTTSEVSAGGVGLKAHHHTAQGAFAATTQAQA